MTQWLSAAGAGWLAPFVVAAVAATVTVLLTRGHDDGDGDE